MSVNTILGVHPQRGGVMRPVGTWHSLVGFRSRFFLAPICLATPAHPGAGLYVIPLPRGMLYMITSLVVTLLKLTVLCTGRLRWGGGLLFILVCRWKDAIETMHREVTAQFAETSCGRDVLQASMTSLLKYYTR